MNVCPQHLSTQGLTCLPLGQLADRLQQLGGCHSPLEGCYGTHHQPQALQDDTAAAGQQLVEP